MQFEQIQTGMIIDGGRRAVTEAEIIEFAKRYDPQWFHIDPVRAQNSRCQ
jgi:acyl dehydratase